MLDEATSGHLRIKLSLPSTLGAPMLLTLDDLENLVRSEYKKLCLPRRAVTRSSALSLSEEGNLP